VETDSGLLRLGCPGGKDKFMNQMPNAQQIQHELL